MLLQNIRAKIGARLSGEGEEGFTLIELLVVMLILGILAAIALPAFFNQKDKAGDSKAKETAHSAQVALETYSTENGGTYEGATAEDLHEIEPTIEGGTESDVVLTELSNTGYDITVTSSTGNTFSIVNEAGELSFPCEVAAANGTNRGGCPAGEEGWSD